MRKDKGSIVLGIVLVIVILIIGLATIARIGQKQSTNSFSNTTGTTYGEAARTESGEKVEGLDGQSTKNEEGTAAAPSGNAQVGGLNGLKVNETSGK